MGGGKKLALQSIPLPPLPFFSKCRCKLNLKELQLVEYEIPIHDILGTSHNKKGNTKTLQQNWLIWIKDTSWYTLDLKEGGWSRWEGWWSHISWRRRRKNLPCHGTWIYHKIISIYLLIRDCLKYDLSLSLGMCLVSNCTKADNSIMVIFVASSWMVLIIPTKATGSAAIMSLNIRWEECKGHSRRDGWEY